MKPAVPNKILLIIIFLLTSYFSPLTTFLYAGDPASANDGKTVGINNRAGKFSIGLEAGYTKLIILKDCDTWCMSSPVYVFNFGYYLSKRIEVGFGIQYFVYFRNFSDTPGYREFDFYPQVKYRIFEGSITPTLGAGFGLSLFWQKHTNEITPFPGGYLSVGVEYQFEKHISIAVNIKFDDIFILIPGGGLQVSF